MRQRKQKPKAKWTYSNIAVRQDTREKFQRVHNSTRIPFSEIADKAIDALLEKGIAFPGQDQSQSKHGPALCQA